jgi:hypothetical protein
LRLRKCGTQAMIRVRFALSSGADNLRQPKSSSAGLEPARQAGEMR